jgi:hypothetical protein
MYLKGQIYNEFMTLRRDMQWIGLVAFLTLS